MALARTWKHFYAEGDDIPTARLLYQKIGDRFSGRKARGSPVLRKLLEDSGDVFDAVTNCGWQWLELDAWTIGKPGVRRYIMSMEDWDEDTLTWITADAERVSA